MTTADDLLLAYDLQLRTEAETRSALGVHQLGTLRLAKFGGGRGFVTYPRPTGPEAAHLAGQVAEVLDHYRRDPEVSEVEWKTRGHDRCPGLHEALVGHGFSPGAPESVMIGEARRLAVEVPVPPGVTLRRVSSEPDVRAMTAMQDAVFGSTIGEETARELLRRLADDDPTELWVAEAQGRTIAAGRVEPVAGTVFAGIWGGATLPAWRGKGIYRALTAARARAALAAGKTLVQSDSTEYSRPILERSGLVKVSTTTPYVWRRQ